MDISKVPLAERIARVLAAQRASINADGSEPHAADVVNDTWREYRDDALAVLKALREPDASMASAGDPAIWENMVRVAIEDAGG